MSSDKFFSKSDWIACWVTFLVSLTVYTLTLQPTLGLEDSGELVVASDYLGVPHPPGYPIWTLLTWFFQWVFHSVTFHGQPNPAWAVNWFSAVAGAAACGVISLLISRSGMDLLQSMKTESRVLGEDTERWFCSSAGICGGLLLAFGQGMWSQAVIAEVYTLNIFFQSLVLVFLYRWMSRPKETNWLILCAFTFGLGITNHQTLMFMGLAMGVGVLCNELEIFSRRNLGGIIATVISLTLAGVGVYFGQMPLQIAGIIGCVISCLFIRHPYVVRDFIITAVMYILLIGFNKWAAEVPEMAKWMWVAGPEKPGFWLWTVYALAVPTVATFTLPNGKVVGPTFLVMFIGLAFYFYMAFSSDQNPPINWGYPRTWQGFMHAITRGQYERVKLASVFTPRFLEQVLTYLMDLRSQFMWPIAILAAVPFAFGWKTGRRNISWLVTTLVAFLSVGIVFMILQNPKTDIQSLFIGRVQYIQSHAIYVIWLGYGILFLMAFLETLVKNNQITKVAGIMLVLLLPLALIHKNYHNKAQLRVVGGAEQNGHDFGWQFGNWQLRGVEGIKEDLQYWYGENTEEFQRQWEAYPNKNYPPPMDSNAIFFGGTDPGRFVPTYMIYSARVRPDVYLITQNALADNTYMNVMRDLYGDQIWIPSPLDTTLAFQRYVEGVRNGTINAGANLQTEDGRVQVQGVAGVMQINAILTKMIFDHNQFRTETKTDEDTRPVGAAVVHEDPALDPATGLPPQRSFYVEESYVLQWMYPYLTPHGLIMKINNKPTPLTEEMIRNDTDFWNWYCERLLNDERFIRDIVARKSFSKLRTSLGGLFHARGKLKAAEAAYRQAVELYDLSPEAHYRLANLLNQQGRLDESIALFESFLKKDPNNAQAREFIRRAKRRGELIEESRALEQKLRSGTSDYRDGFKLITINMQLNRTSRADAMAATMLENWQLTPEAVLELANLMTQHKRFKLVEQALLKYTSMRPEDPAGWINLSALEFAMNKRANALASLQKAVELGGESVRQHIRQDYRFDPFRNDRKFREIVPPAAKPIPGMTQLPGI